MPLEIIESPYRDLTGSVEDYLDQLDARWNHDFVTVVIAEFVMPHWYQGVFHNQSALALKVALKYRRDTVVVNVPFLLTEPGERPATAGDLGLARGSQEPASIDRFEPAAAPDDQLTKAATDGNTPETTST